MSSWHVIEAKNEISASRHFDKSERLLLVLWYSNVCFFLPSISIYGKTPNLNFSLCHSLSQKMLACTSFCAHEKLDTLAHLTTNTGIKFEQKNVCLHIYRDKKEKKCEKFLPSSEMRNFPNIQQFMGCLVKILHCCFHTRNLECKFGSMDEKKNRKECQRVPAA